MKKVFILISLLLCISILCSCNNSISPLPEATKNAVVSTPDTTPALTPDSTPDLTPDVTPDATPDITPDTVPDPTPSATVSATKAPSITPAPAPVDIDSSQLPLIEAVLIGVSVNTIEPEVSNWTDTEFLNVIYSKLNNADGIASWENLGLTYEATADGYLKFDLDKLQKISLDMFNRNFHTGIASPGYFTSGKSFYISPAAGSQTSLEVQTAYVEGQNIIAKGIIAQYGGENTINGFFEATLKVNNECLFGYSLISIKKINALQKTDLYASASSSLVEGTVTYSPRNTLDNNLSTSWVEGSSGLGDGEWIMFTTKDGSKMNLSALEFALGYQDPNKPDLLEKNSAPSKVRIECENNFSQDVEFYAHNDFAALDSIQNTSWVKITILEAFVGTKFEDTCISEIRIYELK